MADLRGKMGRLSALLAEVGLERQCNSINIRPNEVWCFLDRDGFVKLVRNQKVTDLFIERDGEFLHCKCKLRSVEFRTCIWSKKPEDLQAWEFINARSRPALQVDRPKLGAKLPAIEDKRRPIGLPAPEVIDVCK